MTLPPEGLLSISDLGSSGLQINLRSPIED